MFIHVKGCMIFIVISLLLELVCWFNLCNTDIKALMLAVIMLY